jgi:hypothetical protein
MPSTGTSTFSNILSPLRASSSARQGQLHVAGAGRQVDDQVVDVLPVGLVDQLVERLGDHRAAPDHRLVLVDQVADRHRLDLVGDHRLEALAIIGIRPSRKTEHARLTGTVDVGVHDADRGALGGQRQRQVDRHRRLADATLARGDRDDVLDALERFDALLDRVRGDLGLDVDVDVGDPVDLQHLVAQLHGELFAPAERRVAEDHLDLHAAAVDGDVLHGLGGDEVGIYVGVDYARQRSFHLVLGRICHGWISWNSLYFDG